MIFKFEAKWAYDNEVIEEVGIAFGDSFTEVTEGLEESFKNDLLELKLEPIANENYVSLEKAKRGTTANLFIEAVKEDYIW